jgi:hypothetical protein
MACLVPILSGESPTLGGMVGGAEDELARRSTME